MDSTTCRKSTPSHAVPVAGVGTIPLFRFEHICLIPYVVLFAFLSKEFSGGLFDQRPLDQVLVMWVTPVLIVSRLQLIIQPTQLLRPCKHSRYPGPAHKHLTMRTVSPTEPGHWELEGHGDIEECTMDCTDALCMFQYPGTKMEG